MIAALAKHAYSENS